MLVTPAEISILVRPLQYSNADSPMLVTPAGISILVRPLQLSNALFPMLVTPAGILLDLHPRINVLLPVSIIALQLSLLS